VLVDGIGHATRDDDWEGGSRLAHQDAGRRGDLVDPVHQWLAGVFEVHLAVGCFHVADAGDADGRADGTVTNRAAERVGDDDWHGGAGQGADAVGAFADVGHVHPGAGPQEAKPVDGDDVAAPDVHDGFGFVELQLVKVAIAAGALGEPCLAKRPDTGGANAR